MGLFDKFKKKKDEPKAEPKDFLPVYLYDEKEMEEVDAYIAKAFGKFESVFHEHVLCAAH